jgi:predicted nuclease of predicted toxin-antitoxin system
MARLYADENFPRLVVEALRMLGHETVQEAGRANRGIPDEDVLAFAAAQGRAVITQDRWDFIRLHRLFPTHAGIVVCTDAAALDANEQAARIHQRLISVQDLSGQPLRVTRPRR